jgi:alpha-mannosidase
MTPLVPMLADAASSVPRFPLAVEPGSFVATSLKPSADGKAWILRLLNASDRAEALRLAGPALDRGRVSLSNLGEEKGAPVTGPVEVPGFGLLTLRIRK